MPSDSRDDLSYGVLGDARYDPDSQRWRFQRKPGIGRTLQPIGRTRQVLSAGKLHVAVNASKSRKERKSNVIFAVSQDPFIAPSSMLLSSLSQISEAVVSAPALNEAITSELIAFGTARRPGSSRHQRAPVSVVAVAAGPTGDSVKIIRLRSDRYRWEGQPDREFILPSPSTEEFTWWTGGTNNSVLQICFSDQGDGQLGGWLAVRNAAGTTILRPTRTRKIVATSEVPDEVDGEIMTRDPSYLDANQEVQITNAGTGGAPHVHVSFNPWYERQLGILDSFGHWSICDIKGIKNTNSFNVTCAGSTERGNRPVEADLEIDEGWGILLWVGGPSTIVVASQRSVYVHTIGDYVQTFKIPPLDLGVNGEVLLDMKRSLKNPAHVVLLTQFRIFWLQVFAEETLVSLDENDVAAKLLLSWRHHRSSNDKTLRLLLSADFGTDAAVSETIGATEGYTDVTMVMIYSKQTDAISCFTFALGKSTDMGYSVSDPFGLQTRSTAQDFGGANSNRTAMTLRPVQYISSVSNLIHAGHEEQANSEGQIFYLYQLGEDLSILENLFVFSKPLRSQVLSSPFVLISRENFRAADALVDDDFVALDGLCFRDGDDAYAEADQRPSTPAWRTKMAGSGLRATDREWLVDELRMRMRTGQQKQLQPSSFEETIQKAFARTDLERGLHTLSEFLPVKPPLDDVDNMSNAIQGMLNAMYEACIAPSSQNPVQGDDAETQRMRPLQLLVPRMLNIMKDTSNGVGNDDSELSLVSIYENLLNTWKSTWTAYRRKKVPSETRIMLEKDFREIALQLALTARGVLPIEMDEALTEAGESNRIVDEVLDLPIRRKASVSILQSKHRKEPASSETQPGPSTWQSTTSQPIPDSQAYVGSAKVPSSEASTSPLASPNFGTLRKFASFGDPKPLQKSLAGMVDLWTVGEDPNLFDWDLARKVTGGYLESLGPSKKTLRRMIRSASRVGSQSQPSQSQSSQVVASFQITEAISSQNVSPSSPAPDVQASQEAQQPQGSSRRLNEKDGTRPSTTITKPKKAKPKKREPGFR